MTDPLHRLFGLAGKTALVTGGGQGIGRMIAHGLVEVGATVYIASRKIEQCEETAREFARTMHEERTRRPSALRDVLAHRPAGRALPLAEVQPASEITRMYEARTAMRPKYETRFGCLSYG